MKKHILCILVICSTILLLCACTQEPPAPPPTPIVIHSPTQAPQPTQTPVPLPTADEIRARILTTDVLDYIPANTYAKNEQTRVYEVVSSDPALCFSLPAQYLAWLNAATKAASDGKPVNLSVEAPSAPLLSVLAYQFSDAPAVLKQALEQVCKLEVQVIPAGDSYEINVRATPQNPRELFYTLPDTQTVTPISNTFAFAYLITFFDDALQARSDAGSPDLPEFLFPMEPEKARSYNDTWNADRDGGARRHAGTDVGAPEGTNLLACVDAAVLDVGATKSAGNYIVLLGADGTQYHYYHMVRPSDLQAGQSVKQGDVVGHVGNTGNSVSNHLHFTIVTKDGYYVNPYSDLVASQERASSASLQAY